MIMEKNTKLEYRKVGDYMIPNLTLPPEETAIRLGKWGMLHKDYLEKHKPVLFATLLIQGKLYQHCAKVEEQANDMFDTLIEQLKKTEGITEKLKGHNQWEWIQRMENIQARVNSIVYQEIISI